MSRRVTTQSEMKEKALVAQACKAQNISYTEHGDTIRFTSGGLNGAILDLRTGNITGDSDYGHTTGVLGSLRQAYGEAKYRKECLKQGVTIESRTMNKQGDIVLLCSYG
jgi:hypothetical protein